MHKYKKPEIELTPHLLQKLFEYVKQDTTTMADIAGVMTNLTWLSKCDEVLSLEEFDLAIQKPPVT